jgi:uncharacterized membrane protein YedE/YeeE
MGWEADVPILLVALICGFVFGCGLLISGMVQPAKVLAFLDFLGAWDPSLLVTMAAALAVTSAGFVLARRRAQPVLTEECQWPTAAAIDRDLVVGAVLFGIGWGLVGLCPGPALANLASLSRPIIVFVIAMGIGIALVDWWRLRRAVQEQRRLMLARSTDG